MKRDFVPVIWVETPKSYIQDLTGDATNASAEVEGSVKYIDIVEKVVVYIIIQHKPHIYRLGDVTSPMWNRII